MGAGAAVLTPPPTTCVPPGKTGDTQELAPGSPLSSQVRLQRRARTGISLGAPPLRAGE